MSKLLATLCAYGVDTNAEALHVLGAQESWLRNLLEPLQLGGLKCTAASQITFAPINY
jgi:hypothetical protein